MKDPEFAKRVVFLNSLVPLAILIWDKSHDQLGANPNEALLHKTGNLAIIFLLLSLAVTPLRKLTGKNWYSLFRKMLGLFAFFYMCLHLLIYLSFYSEFDLRKFAAAMVSNKFIILGLAAFLMLVPLAITSTNGMIKRLGAAKWKRLHQLVYVAAIAAVTHFWMSQKRDISKPALAAAVLFVLLAYRLVPKRKPVPVAAKI